MFKDMIKNITITADADIDIIFENAVLALDQLHSGETFIVRDLFRGFEWNRISLGNRIKLGNMFLHYVEYGEGKGVIEKVEQKTPRNQQLYAKL